MFSFVHDCQLADLAVFDSAFPVTCILFIVAGTSALNHRSSDLVTKGHARVCISVHVDYTALKKVNFFYGVTNVWWF